MSDEFNYARHREVHSTPELWRTVCDGCQMMTCIEQKSRIKRWRYYCSALAKSIEPHKLTECPKGKANI